MKEEKLFKLAKQASEFSNFPRYHLGAVIAYKNRVLSVGWNSTKPLPMQKKYNKYRGFDPDDNCNNPAHAEMLAISKLIKTYELEDLDIGKLQLCVYREHKDGSLALAAPCAACANAIREIGIKHLYYTGENSYINEEIK